MNPHKNLARTVQVPPIRRLRAAASAALPALVATLTVLSLAFPSLALAVPQAPAVQVRYVRTDAAEGGDGLSWDTAFTTIQSALASIPSGDIWVAEGIYYPDPTGLVDPREAAFELKQGVHLFGGFDPADGEDTWDERDPVTNITVLSGDLDGNDFTDGYGIITDTAKIVGANSYHVVWAEDPVETSAELNGFTITGGLADGVEPADRGAGIYSSEASPTLVSLTVQGNKATNMGGGMFMEIEGAAFDDVTFRWNSAQTGGGLYASESVNTISGITFEENEATVSGGGMHLATTLGQSLSNLTFTGNTAVTGGGMHLATTLGQSLSNLTFTGNTAVTGGGLYVQSTGDPSTLSGSFTANFASEDGGGIYLDASVFNLNNVDLEDNEASEEGGGIYAELGTHTLTGVTFTGNQAGSAGGGFYGERNEVHLVNSELTLNSSVVGGGMYVDDNANSSYSLTVSGTDFIANTASEDGGGLYVSRSQGEMSSSSFIANEATTGDGGGFYLEDSSPFALSSTDFDSNDSAAGSGGGMYVAGSDADLVAVTFDANDAQGGGGFYVAEGTNAELSRCDFSGNSATNGGGMYIASSDPTLVNVAFSGNEAIAGSGGGLWNYDGSPTLVNVLISGNAATLDGGGMHSSGAASNVELINLTVAGNAAGGDGGGIYNLDSSLTLANTVIWDNQDVSGPGTASASLSGSTDSIDYSLIQSQDPAGTGNLDGNLPGNDPDFVVPVDPTTAPTTSGILSVKWGSPIIDVGDDGAIPAGPLYEEDLDGNQRIYNAVVDIGAYEFQLACPTEPTTRLYVDHTASLGNTGGSWLLALKNLRDAFTLAADCDGITEIWVAEGVYRPDEGEGIVPDDRTETYELIDGVAVYGGFDPSDEDDTWEERDPVNNVTVLSGDVDRNDTATGGIVHTPGGIYGDNSYHVVMASEVSDTTVLDGFTITAGKANGAAEDPTSRGGGLYNDAGSPTLANLTFIGNSAGDGGGLADLNGASPPLTDMVFENNQATSTGGGIYNEASTPTLSHLVFTGNYADHGGGLANLSGSNPPLTDVQFTGNTAGTAGGGIYNLDSSPTLTGTLFSYNSADNAGGGIYNLNSSPTLTNTVLSANTASNGGALYNDASNPTLIQARISGNSVTGSGAAIYNTASSPVLVNVTVAGNRAGSMAGGALNTTDSDPVLRNTIFWDNRDSTGTGTASATIYNSDGESVPAIDYSLVQMLSSINHTGSDNTARNPWFTAPLDPDLAPSTAGDFTLAIFSAAIDAGNDAFNSLEYDLTGGPRVINGTIDMGAYEAPFYQVYDVYLPVVLRNYAP